jgi:purine-binding chemotaxis protein CheW
MEGTAAMEPNQTRTLTHDIAQAQGQYLTFHLMEENYGIDVLKIREIIRLMPITKVPRLPGFVKGVINLRGKVIPVIDLREKFGLPVAPCTKQTCIIVVDVWAEEDNYLIGVIVDEVNDVMSFAIKDLEPSPSYSMDLKTNFIKAMGKSGSRVWILLDIDRILSPAETVRLAEIKV